MPIYMVEPIQEGGGARLRADGVIVAAGDAAAARDTGRSLYPSDSNEAWNNALVTELVEVGTINDVGGLAGFEMRVKVLAPDGGPVVADVTVQASAIETADTLAAKMVTALIAAGLTNAAYASPTLTVATAPDLIGDHKLTPIIRTFEEPLPDGVDISSYHTNRVDEGIAAAVLTFDMVVAALKIKAYRDYRFSEGAVVPTPY